MAKYSVVANEGGAEIQGWGEVMQNLNREIQNIIGRSMGGLIDATILIHRAVENEEPKIPVDTANLRHSWFTSTFYEGKNPGIFFGYSANYALWVHEMVDADFTTPRMRKKGKAKKATLYTPRAGSGAKFLETKINRHHDDILKAIGNKAKIK